VLFFEGKDRFIDDLGRGDDTDARDCGRGQGGDGLNYLLSRSHYARRRLSNRREVGPLLLSGRGDGGRDGCGGGGGGGGRRKWLLRCRLASGRGRRS
jgi:hypothetical protein